MGGDSGIGDHPTAAVRPWIDRHEESGQQLLPQLCHASALHSSRLREQVSTCIHLFSLSVFLMINNHSCYFILLIGIFLHCQTVRASSEPLHFKSQYLAFRKLISACFVLTLFLSNLTYSFLQINPFTVYW